MSSEEENEVEFQGRLKTAVYKVKICVWRATAIADYSRLVYYKQTDAFEKERCGIHRALRVPTDGVERSAALTCVRRLAIF